MGQLNNKSPNLQSTLVQSSMSNTLGVGINSMPMSIANNGGTQAMSTMQGSAEMLFFLIEPQLFVFYLPFQL